MISVRTLPQREQAHVRAIVNNVFSLDGYLRSYVDAVNLMLHAQSISRAEWVLIAQRDSAMTVWHFWKTLQKGFSTTHCQEFGRKTMIERRLKVIRQRFKESFPDVEDARDAVGHSAEKRISNESRRANAVNGPFEIPGLVKAEGGSSVTIGAASMGGRMYSTHKSAHEKSARMVSHDCSPSSAQKLADVRNDVAREFIQIDDEMRKTEKTPQP